MKWANFAQWMLAAVAAQAYGQDWKQINPATTPPEMQYATAAYDSVRQQVVLFGGFSFAAGGPQGTTFVWDGNTWTLRTPLHSPSPRYSHVMAFDGIRGEVVLFGGQTRGDVFYDETWVWNGVDWTQRTPQHRPPGRVYGGMAFDAARANVVLYGGLTFNPGTGLQLVSDTWTWDGTDWTQKSPLAAPSPRQGFGMGYDAQTGRIVMFGGATNTNLLLDTWTWNGKTWTQAITTHTPAAPFNGCMSSERVVLFGGAGSPGNPSSETWTWVDGDWVAAAPAHRPGGRSACALVFQAARGEFLLFGGQAGTFPSPVTWIYSTAAADVTGQVQATISALVFNRVSKTYVAAVSVTNIGTTSIQGPLSVSLLNLPRQLGVVNPSGSEFGVPYLTLPGFESANGVLAPGQSATVQVQLPQLTFTPSVFAGARP